MKLQDFPIAIALFTLFGLSCTPETTLEPREVDWGYEYYPLQLGLSWTYEVDSVYYLSDGEVGFRDTVSVRLREVLADTFTDLSGVRQYRLERYIRAGADSTWVFAGVAAMSRTKRQAIRQEGNFRLIRLPFPLALGGIWQPAAHFDEQAFITIGSQPVTVFEAWSFQVLDTAGAFQLGDASLDQVVTVENRSADLDPFTRRRVVERYAPGIGLVSREMDILDTDCLLCCDDNADGGYDLLDTTICAEVPWAERAEVGFLLRQKLIAFE